MDLKRATASKNYMGNSEERKISAEKNDDGSIKNEGVTL